MGGDPGRSSTFERTALRARAEQACRRARALTAQTLVLSANAQRQFQDAGARVSLSKDLQDRLKGIVIQHARLARALDDTPEHAVMCVKEAAAEAIAIAKSKAGTIDLVDAQLLREQLVRWTVDAYFSVGPFSS